MTIPSKKWKKRFYLACILLNIPFLLISCMSVVLLFNIINPMSSAFITPLTVKNNLPEDLYFTPIATYDYDSQRNIPRPQYLYRFPNIPAFHDRNFKVSSGKSRTIYFDRDDKVFSDIYIKTNHWQRVLIVDSDPTTHPSKPPDIISFVIDTTLNKLQLPSNEIIEIVSQPDHQWYSWFVDAAGIAFLFSFFFFIKRFRSCR